MRERSENHKESKEDEVREGRGLLEVLARSHCVPKHTSTYDEQTAEPCAMLPRGSHVPGRLS